jgi:NAD(P)-dependent dehydrogenase (short-subunit alcohol dehydrogenase family)
MALTEEQIDACLGVLRALLEDRGLLAEVDPARRRELLTAAGQLAHPSATDLRGLARARRRKDRRDARSADQRVLEQSEIRAQRRAAVFATPLPALPEPLEHGRPPPAPGSTPTAAPELARPRACYVCKEAYRSLHFFYDAMCPRCGDFNYQKRNQSVPLVGRTALITGARVKIGYQAAIKLLRAGARVLVTTRFPVDAGLRYAREPDFAAWSGRLEIFGLDLRHTPSVGALVEELERRVDRLDFIINNACQTVRRPAGFYAHLMELESTPRERLPAPAASVLARVPGLGLLPERSSAPPPPALATGRGDLELFPVGRLDADLQQVDLREVNSWRLRLAEVPIKELLEVHLVNAVAPFVLNARLKPLMLRVPSFDKHIVNVSAMEGQFYRSFKTDRHPHTNMAKAALNMMTRTSSPDYAKDGIFMNSVDTGWVTDEDPLAIAAKKAEEQGFSPPLDIVDGAARILDPIFDGLATRRHVHGQFFKDYRSAPW